jgi:hypothetical protein
MNDSVALAGNLTSFADFQPRLPYPIALARPRRRPKFITRQSDCSPRIFGFPISRTEVSRGVQPKTRQLRDQIPTKWTSSLRYGAKTITPQQS